MRVSTVQIAVQIRSFACVAVGLLGAPDLLADEQQRDGATGISEAAAESSQSVTQPENAESRAAELFWRAHELHAGAAYADALKLFLAAYELSPQPELLFNIAQTHRSLGDCPRALTAFTEFVKHATPGPGLTEAQTRREELQAVCGGVKEAPALPVQPSAEPAAVVPPPAVKIEEARASPRPVFPPTAESTGTRTAIAWSSLGAGSLAAVGSVFLAFRASDRSAELEAYVSRAKDSQAVWDDEGAGLERDGERAQKYALVLGGASVGLVALGVALLLTEPTAADSQSAFKNRFRLRASPGAVEAGWGGNF